MDWRQVQLGPVNISNRGFFSANHWIRFSDARLVRTLSRNPISILGLPACIEAIRPGRVGPTWNEGEVVPDPRSTPGRAVSGQETAADRPAPKGGTADSASAKVPSAAWPRNAPERHHRRHQAPRDLPRIVEDKRLPSW